jgi:esterase
MDSFMQLHFQSYGEGFPLVILHGLFGSLENWQTLSRQWSQNYQVLAVDLRNHGRSPHSEVFNYEVMVEDLRELLAAQKLERVHLLGHSLGGKVAMHFALGHPQAVEKLIVADIAPKKYPPIQLPLIEAMLALDLGLYRERSELGEALKTSIPNATVRQFLLKNITRDEAGALVWKINLRSIQQNYRQLNEELSTGRAFNGPVRFIRGGRSDYITEADRDLILRLFPQAEIETIEEAGHWVQAEAPEKFSRLVLDFLGSVQ